MSSLPVYKLRDFRNFSQEDRFYTSGLRTHVREHDFTHVPHKHDFYVLVLFTSGKGSHEIDFKTYRVQRGSLFLMRPGQMHNWKLSADADGYIFFHTRSFFEEGFTSEVLSDYPFYSSAQASPLLMLIGESYTRVSLRLQEILAEYTSDLRLKMQKLRGLLQLVYIDLARISLPAKLPLKESYLHKLHLFETLIDRHFMETRSVQHYASLMHLSEKHLNRITQLTLHKTSTELISERVMLEAKRLLLHGGLNVSQVADTLNFRDNSYFTRFFKKQAGETPIGFLNKYKKVGN